MTVVDVYVRIMLLCLTPAIINVRQCGFFGLFTGSGRFCAPIFLFVGRPCGAIFDPLGIQARLLLISPPLLFIYWPFLP